MSTIDQQNHNQGVVREVEELLERIAAPLRRTIARNPAFESEAVLTQLRGTAAGYGAVLSLQTQWEVDFEGRLTPRYFELADEVHTLVIILKQRVGMH